MGAEEWLEREKEKGRAGQFLSPIATRTGLRVGRCFVVLPVISVDTELCGVVDVLGVLE